MSWKVTFLVAVSIVAIASVAVAASGGGSKSVTICAAKGNGALRLAPKSGKCGKGARKLVVARQGAQGAQGPPGPVGAAGAPGMTASIQPEAVRFVSPPVAGGCVANPGTFCGSAIEGLAHWRSYDGWGQVGFQKDAAGYVHLQGGAAFGGSGVFSEDIFYLPAGYRPSSKVQLASTQCEGDPLSVLIRTDGGVAPRGVVSCVILDGISFRP